MLIGGIDFESTGTDPAQDRIVEVAIKVVDLETGEAKFAYTTRVNPECHIPADAVAVHGIADADVIRAPKFAAIATGFVALIGKVDLIVGHNIRKFDMPMLKAELDRAGFDTDSIGFPPLHDTMLEGRWATFDGKIPSLGEYCFALDVDYDPSAAHAALYDVDVNLQAFRSGWKLGHVKIPGIPAPGH